MTTSAYNKAKWKKQPTDYAKAVGCQIGLEDIDNVDYLYSSYLLCSPCHEGAGTRVLRVKNHGHASDTCDVTSDDMGVVPALTIQID